MEPTCSFTRLRAVSRVFFAAAAILVVSSGCSTHHSSGPTRPRPSSAPTTAAGPLSIVRIAPYSAGPNPLSPQAQRHFIVVSPTQVAFVIGGSSSCPAKIVAVTRRTSTVAFRLKSYRGACTTDLELSDVEVTLNQPVFGTSKPESIEIVYPPSPPLRLTR